MLMERSLTYISSPIKESTNDIKFRTPREQLGKFTPFLQFTLQSILFLFYVYEILFSKEMCMKQMKTQITHI